jgi:mannose-6-phosphate isomerase
MDETGRDLAPRRATARLWPQTERLKAALLLRRDGEARAAAQGLWQYLQTPRAGLWRDKMREDGTLVEEPAPASSLYHIICAVASLKEYGPLT